MNQPAGIGRNHEGLRAETILSYAHIIDTMVKLSFAMLLGFVLFKTKIINAETNKSLSGMIINVTSPALVIYSVCSQNEINAETGKLVGFGFVLYLLMPVLALGIVWLMRAQRDKRGVYQLLLVFGNVSFIGFPIVQAMYGEQAIFYMNILNIPFTLMIFTYGIRILRDPAAGGGAPINSREILSPGLLAGVLSLVIYFFQIPIPAIAASALGFIGNVTTPLSMVVIGSIVAGFHFKELFSDGKLYILTFIKLLLIPLAGFFVIRLLFEDTMLVGIITLSLAMPSGSLCAMVCQQYGNRTQADTAALGVFITTVLSMFTIPLVILCLS